jgi:hypothetical protein
MYLEVEVTMPVRVLLVVIAIVIGAVAPAAVARGASEVGAVRAEYQRTALLEYFGPPAAVCTQLTPADRSVFSRFFVRRETCLRTAHGVMHLLRHCTSSNGFSPSQWRNAVQASMALVKVRLLSSTSAQVTDPLLDRDTVVRSGHRWMFSHGWPPVEC